MRNDRGREHRSRSLDGHMLDGRMWECESPQGIVVVRTPYDADQHASTAHAWNARGYHCLVQDVRGRYRSEGPWSPYDHEHDDGGRLIRHLTREYPGLPLVLYGASYAAHTALEAAVAAAGEAGSACAAIIVLVPALGLAETAWDSTGTPQIRHRIGWWHQHGRTRRSQPPLTPDELDRRTDQARVHGVLEAAEHWGWTASALSGWRRLWSSERVDVEARYGHLDLPLLVISGDEDFFHEDAVRLAREWKAPCHFVSGPWGHRLAGGITDASLRARVRAAGGLSRIIDPWLAAHNLSSGSQTWTAILQDATHTRSTLDAESGDWHHERTAP